MTEAKVRLATPADVPALMALERRAATAAHWSREQYEDIFARGGETGELQEQPGLTPSPASSANARLKPRSSREEELRRIALVIEDEAVVQGFLVARATGREWELENIAVAGPGRRQGRGTRLLDELLGQARAEGAESIWLEVRASNRAARALYEKWAFVECGRRRSYYRNPGEDAVVYRLNFV